MKALHEYLIESTQEYSYRIKIVGDIEDGALEKLEKSFAAFDLVNMTGPTVTPITKNPIGFPGAENEVINIIDVTFKYPASTEQFVEMVRHHGIAANRILVLCKQFDDSMQQEEDSKEKSGDDSLLGRDFAKNTSEQDDAKNEYGGSYQNSDVIKNAAKSKYEIAGGVPARATTTNDLPMGTNSPLTNVVREKM